MKTHLAGSAGKLAILGVLTFGIITLTPLSLLAQEAHLDFSDGTGSAAPGSILSFLLIGILLGLCGQIARSAVGLKKEMDDARNANQKWDNWFNMQELLVSLLLGAAAGAFAAVGMLGASVDKRFLIACVAAGYAGSDFIQGFMQTNNIAGKNGDSKTKNSSEEKPVK